MRRGPVFVAAVAVACLPAVTGLVGNQSFSHSVPVRVPSQARIGPPEAIDATVRPPSPSLSPTTLSTPHGVSSPARGQSQSAGHEAKNDSPHGAVVTSTAGRGRGAEAEPQQSPDLQRGRPATTEPDDDRGSSPIASPAPRLSDDRGPGSGPDDRQSSGGSGRGHDGRGSSDDRRGHG